MANQSLITNGAKVSQVEQVYYSPVAVTPPFIISNNTVVNPPLGTLYAFLAKVDPWADDVNPPMPTQDVRSLKKLFKNMFAAKHITVNDISPVIERKDWSSGTVYDYYDDSVDMFATDNNGYLLKSFYIRNRYDQVFKCLWNNNGSPSTVEPYFQPGVYNTNNVFQDMLGDGGDGYKWKYIYTIDSGLKLIFQDPSWMPVPVGSVVANPLTPAGAGSIDAINVIAGGQLYDPSTAPITVTITGDGSGAVATAVVLPGTNYISDILVTNPGSGYTYADVTITSSKGFGAQAIAPASPIGGHGYDPVSELGCSRVMLVAQFNGSEGGIIPTDVTYTQVGVVVNPTLNSLSNTPQGYIPANGGIYKVYTEFIVAPGFGGFTSDEIVYQGDPNNPTFIGTVLSFNPGTDIISVLNMTGEPTLNAPIKGQSTNTTRTLLQVNPPDFQIFSGYISYVENRSSVQRSSDGIEQYKFVLGY